MEPRWEKYQAEINEETAWVHADLSLMERCPLPELPLMARVQVEIPPIDVRPNMQRDKWLNQLESGLAQYLAGRMHALLVGYILWDCRIEFYFYTPQALHLDTAVHAVMSRFDTTEYVYESQEDADWCLYQDVLFPNPFEQLCIRNRKMLELLRDQGDDLSRPRPLDHWFYLAQEAQGQEMRTYLEEEGFTLLEFVHEPEFPEQPWVLRVSREEPLLVEQLDELVGDLLDLADEFQATYDGWETEALPGDSCVG